jgi:hypothetical protein
MGDGVVGGRWIGIQSHDPIGLKWIGQLLPFQADFEPPQWNRFQLDRFRAHAHSACLQIDVDFEGLLLQGYKITVDVCGG